MHLNDDELPLHMCTKGNHPALLLRQQTSDTAHHSSQLPEATLN